MRQLKIRTIQIWNIFTAAGHLRAESGCYKLLFWKSFGQKPWHWSHYLQLIAWHSLTPQDQVSLIFEKQKYSLPARQILSQASERGPQSHCTSPASFLSACFDSFLTQYPQKITHTPYHRHFCPEENNFTRFNAEIKVCNQLNKSVDTFIWSKVLAVLRTHNTLRWYIALHYITARQSGLSPSCHT